MLDGFAIGPVADPNAQWLYNSAYYLRRQFQLLKEAYNFNKIVRLALVVS
jgi:hypothetical protein